MLSVSVGMLDCIAVELAVISKVVEDACEVVNASDEEAVPMIIAWLVAVILVLYLEVFIEVMSAVESSDVIVTD